MATSIRLILCILTCIGYRSSAWLESCIGSGGSFFCETAVTGCECGFDSGNEVDRLVLVLRGGFGCHDGTDGLFGRSPTLPCNDCL